MTEPNPKLEQSETIALVVGAAGPNVGSVVPALAAHGVRVRALIHDQRGDAIARRRGAAEVVAADLRDIESLRRAAAGVDAVFHVIPAFAADEAEMGSAMVQAATDAGVEKFVFSSVYHPSLPLRNHSDKRPAEAALFESGLNFTVLQPAMFMQNLGGAWKGAVESGRLIMPYSIRAKMSYVDYRDVAEAVAIAMTTDRLDYGTFELAAPGMVDRVAIAELMTEASGREIVAGEISVDQWLQSTGMPAGPLKDGLAAMMRHYDEYGFAGGNGLVLRTVLEREPRSLGAFIDELANPHP